MTTRVTAAELLQIFDTDKTEDVLEEQFITTANLFVTQHLSTSGLSDAILAKVELYLAAHFLALTEEGGAVVMNRFGDSSMRYADIYAGGGLRATRFGQTAIALDPSGTLSKFTMTKKAELRVL